MDETGYTYDDSDMTGSTIKESTMSTTYRSMVDTSNESYDFNMPAQSVRLAAPTMPAQSQRLAAPATSAQPYQLAASAQPVQSHRLAAPAQPAQQHRLAAPASIQLSKNLQELQSLEKRTGMNPLVKQSLTKEEIFEIHSWKDRVHTPEEPEDYNARMDRLSKNFLWEKMRRERVTKADLEKYSKAPIDPIRNPFVQTKGGPPTSIRTNTLGVPPITREVTFAPQGKYFGNPPSKWQPSQRMTPLLEHRPPANTVKREINPIFANSMYGSQINKFLVPTQSQSQNRPLLKPAIGFQKSPEVIETPLDFEKRIHPLRINPIVEAAKRQREAEINMLGTDKETNKKLAEKANQKLLEANFF